LISDEVLAVVLALAIIGLIYGFSQAFLAGRTVEPFSELAILGPEKKIANYPKEVEVGQPFKLYLYVGNHEGKVVYYIVYIKLGNISTPINSTTPSNATILNTYEFILADGQNITIPLNLTIKKPALNARLIFELWALEKESLKPRYTGRWCQIWLNVTKPMKTAR